jgi:hypothetical protein
MFSRVFALCCSSRSKGGGPICTWVFLVTSIVKIAIIARCGAHPHSPVFETLGGSSSTEMEQRQEDTDDAFQKYLETIWMPLYRGGNKV